MTGTNHQPPRPPNPLGRAIIWTAITIARVLRDSLSREKHRGKRNPPDPE